MSKTNSKLTLIGILVVSIVGSVQAQEIEEIMVTAQKREQSVMDVPATMDVISGAFLERTNTLQLDDLSRMLPNVVI
jgi:iron complex outermembrane receptor protein